MDGVSQRKPKPTHPNEPKNYSGELIDKGFGPAPDSLPGCIGQYSKNQAKCVRCPYKEICEKTLPREACLKLLQEILNEIEETKKVLKF